MAQRRRRKARAGGKRRSPDAGSPVQPPDAARALLKAGRHKDAVAGFKALLKGDDCPEWRRGLADAYAGRARELANKGMLREASAMWEQRAKACATALVVPEYLVWLLGSGQPRRVAAMVREHRERLESTEGGRDIAAWLGAAALSGMPEVLEELPGDHPVVRDFAVADAALRAFCQGDDDQLENALGRIAYRSPYRDLRTLLKACGELGSNPASATALARRIGSDSPYRGLVRILEMAGVSRVELAEALETADASFRNVVLALLGLSGPEAAFAKAAARLGAEPRPKALLELVTRHVRLLGTETARRLASPLIVHYPEGFKAFCKTFGHPSQFDRSRWFALAVEIEGSVYDVDEAWRETLETLLDGLDEEDNRIRTALILRRIGAAWSRNDEAIHPFMVSDLETIVELDPADRESWLKLIKTTREARDLKASRRHLDGALTQFPDDPAVLLAAVETAVASNAYKKAARYATRLVEVDPLNPRAKRLLLAAHLDHARKQIRRGALPAAAREIGLAEGWAGAESETGEIALLRGMLALSEGAPDAAGPLLRQAEAALGGGLTGRFSLRMEALRLRRDAGAVLAAADLRDPPEPPDPTQVVHLMRTIQGLGPEEQTGVAAVLDAMAGPLGRATRGRYSEAELELVCEALKRHEAHRLLEKYARAALRAWKERPVFVYYLVYAKGDGAIYDVPPRDHARVERALDRARKAGDQRTAHRISAFLASGYFPLPGRVPMSPPMDFEEEYEPLGSLGPDAMFKLLGELFGEMEDLIDQTTPRELSPAVENDAGPMERTEGRLEGFEGNGPGGRGGPRTGGRGRRVPRRSRRQKDLFE